MDFVEQLRTIIKQVQPHLLTKDDRIALLNLVEESANSVAHSAA